MPSATSLRPSQLKSPAETILSPTFDVAARLPIVTFASVSRSTGPPALSGPAMAWGAIATPSAAVTPAHTNARRRLVFNTPYSLSWADSLVISPSPPQSCLGPHPRVGSTGRLGEPERPAGIGHTRLCARM